MNKKIILGVVIAVGVMVIGMFALKTVAFMICYSDWEPDNCYVDKFPYFTKKNKTDNLGTSPKNVNDSETSDWKTYTNSEYGFEFQYPDNLEITEEFDTSKNPESQISNWFSLSLHDKKDRQIFGFSLSINHPGIGFEGTETVSDTYIVIGGVKAQKEILQSIGGEDKGLKSALYNFTKDKDDYMVYASDPEKIDQILSTFKFTK